MTSNKTTKLVGALAFVAATAASASAFAADINVYPGQAWQSAISHAQPGDRVLMHAGTYVGGGWVGPVHGTASAPVTVLSADGPHTAVIDGQNQAGVEALRIGDASSYLVFDGLEVKNSGDNAVHIDGGCDHVTFRNMYVHDAGQNGDVFKANQCTNLTVENSEFARPGPYVPNEGNPYQQCLDFVNVVGGDIRDNYFHDGGSQLFFVKGGSANITIERNVYANEHAGASDPMVGIGGATDTNLLGSNQYEANNIVFRNNILVGGVQGGLGVYDTNGAYIANNLFINNNVAEVQFRAGNGPAGGSTNIQVVDNVFTDTRGQMPAPFSLWSHTVSNVTTNANTYWNNGSPTPTGGYINVLNQPGTQTANPLVTAPSVTATRATIIATAKPAAGSPVAGNGINTAVAPFYVTDDINATARGGRLDRGPYLLSGSTTTTGGGTTTTGGTTTGGTTTGGTTTGGTTSGGTTTGGTTTGGTTSGSTSTSGSCAVQSGYTRLANNGTTVCAPHPASPNHVGSDCCDWWIGVCYAPTAADRACGSSTSGGTTSTTSGGTSTGTTSGTTSGSTSTGTTSGGTTSGGTTTGSTGSTSGSTSGGSCAVASGQTRLANNGTTVCAPHPASPNHVGSDCCDWWIGVCYAPTAADLACGSSTSGGTSTSTGSTSTTSSGSTSTTSSGSTSTTTSSGTTSTSTCALPSGQTRLARNGTTVCAPHGNTLPVSSDCCDWNTGICYAPTAHDTSCGSSGG